MWNEIKEHGDPRQFKNDDVTLVSKIKWLNSFFHAMNGEANKTPKISEDLNKNTKNKKGHSRYFYNYKELTTDGIHPVDILAKLWLKKFQKIVLEKCFI